MSDTNECCVCYEATEHSTPCNHLVCESCYPRLNTCPMCRASLGRLVVKKKAIINLKNTDNKCFMWAVTRALHPAGQNLSQ